MAFDSRLKLEFHDSKITSDAGLLAYRELDEALSLTDLGDELLNDWRTGKNTQHSMVALMRQAVRPQTVFTLKIVGDIKTNNSISLFQRSLIMKQLPRREFIKMSGALGAGLAILLLLTATATEWQAGCA